LAFRDPIPISPLVALIVWGLLVIAKQDSGKLNLKHFWRQLQADCHRDVFEFRSHLGKDIVEVTS
jgi:hypothetical protein